MMKTVNLGLFSAITLVMSTSAWAADISNHLKDVRVVAGKLPTDATEIEVVGTTKAVYSVRVAEGGSKLIVDFANADVSGAPEALTHPVGLVGGILTQGFSTAQGSSARLAVSLVKHATYQVVSDGGTLRIVLRPTEGATTVALDEPKGVAPVAPKAAAAAQGSAVEVTGVRFDRTRPLGRGERCAYGCERIVVDATRPLAYSLSATSRGTLRLALKGARRGEGVSEKLDLPENSAVLRNVSAIYDESLESTILEVEREDEATGTLSLEGNSLVWNFEVPGSMLTEGGSPKKGGPATRKTVTVAKEAVLDAGPKIETSILGSVSDGNGSKVEVTEGGQAGFTSSVAGQTIGSGMRYSGRRIDLDLKDADIHNILRLLADVGKVNIITSDDVGGSVTIRMRNVPWDQALDVVLQVKGLGMVRQGNLIRVAPAGVLQKEREIRLAQQKQEFELLPLETRLIPVSYAEAGEIQARARELLSPRGSLAVDDRTNVLIARDIAGNLNHVEELVRSLDTQTPQVLVEARIVEANSRYFRDFGIQWGGDATFSAQTGNPTGLAFPSTMTVAGGATDALAPRAGLSPTSPTVPNPNFAVNLPAPAGTGQGGAIGFSFGSIDNNFNLSLRLSAAEASGLVRIVSSPRILTLENRDARISQGTMIPFSQVSAQGVQTTFQNAQLQLLVRPHVTADGSIALRVKVNRDEPDFNQTSARGDPTILKREAETELLVLDGHTAVIGGVFTRNTGRNLDQVPFFGDIPILGTIFQRRRSSDIRTELVIFLTPRIVNRAESLGK